MATQLSLGQEPIETVCISPTKEMPLELYRVLHRLSYYVECMERLPDGRVLWDEKLEEVYSEQSADAAYHGLQSDWFSCTMEVPKAFMVSNGLIEE